MMEEFMAQERKFRQFPDIYGLGLNKNTSTSKQTTSFFESQLSSLENIVAARRVLIQNNLI